MLLAIGMSGSHHSSSGNEKIFYVDETNQKHNLRKYLDHKKETLKLDQSLLFNQIFNKY